MAKEIERQLEHTNQYDVCDCVEKFMPSSLSSWASAFPPDPNPPRMSMLPRDYTKTG